MSEQCGFCGQEFNALSIEDKGVASICGKVYHDD